MNNIRDKFEAWYQTQFSEIVDFSLFAPNSAYYKDDDIDEAWDVWQAATEQSQKEIEILLNQQERLIALVDEKDARIAELEARLNVDFPLLVKLFDNIDELKAREKVLVEYKNSVIDQFVTAHHSYDESISAYENISKLIAYHQDIALDPKVSSVAARWVTQIEGLQAREKELVEAISSSLNCIREEINLNNYTETLLGDFISYYGDMVIILQYALANVRGE